MRILDKLERKIGWFAIKKLALYLVIGNAAVWLISFIFVDNSFIFKLGLVPALVSRGEVWRLITFILTNSYGGMPLFVLIELYFLYMVGSNLEAVWGSFKFTLYFFIGYLLTVAVSMIFGYPVWGARYIHLSLFLAFAQIAPDMKLLLFFIIPVKIKWLAWAAWAFLAYEFISSNSLPPRLLILAPLAAYAIFFGSEIMATVRTNRKVVYNRREFTRKKDDAKVIRMSFHKCEVCGVTEVDSPQMDFRYCSKCEGDHEFCSEHLYDHPHHGGA
jgi:membrane associated rhomboid family serine protease